MGNFQPKVIYRTINEDRKDSIIRYIGNRVLRNNKNFMFCLTGSVGAGKSYSGLAIGERYSKMFNIPFNPLIHVISSLKELLQLITADDIDKKIQFGSYILFDEPQVEANAHNWQSDMNQAFSQLISTFRNQRLIVGFAVPNMSMIDRQSRLLFHGDFKVEGFDKNTKITTIKPRFLEPKKGKDDFYAKRLIVEYKIPEKEAMNITKINRWHIPLASKETIDVYETKKKRFTDDLNKKLLAQIELQEKQAGGKNKNDELLKLKDLFDEYGEDYLKISEQMPHLTPFTIEKYIWLIKKSRKLTRTQTIKPKDNFLV